MIPLASSNSALRKVGALPHKCKTSPTRPTHSSTKPWRYITRTPASLPAPSPKRSSVLASLSATHRPQPRLAPSSSRPPASLPPLPRVLLPLRAPRRPRPQVPHRPPILPLKAAPRRLAVHQLVQLPPPQPLLKPIALLFRPRIVGRRPQQTVLLAHRRPTPVARVRPQPTPIAQAQPRPTLIAPPLRTVM